MMQKSQAKRDEELGGVLLGQGTSQCMAMGEMPGDLGDEMDRWRVGRSTGRR